MFDGEILVDVDEPTGVADDGEMKKSVAVVRSRVPVLRVQAPKPPT